MLLVKFFEDLFLYYLIYILVSIDQVMLFDLTPDFIAKMIKKLGAKVPICISVAKARTAKSKVYLPLEPYLKIAGKI